MNGFFPKRKSAFERCLLCFVLFSPLFVLGHFMYRLQTNAYPPEADSIGIPVFFYWLFPFPLFAFLSLKGRKGLDEAKLHPFWNPDRHWISILWTIACIYPIGFYLAFLLVDSIQSRFIPSIIYSLFLIIALLIYRAGALSKKPASNAERGSHGGVHV